MKTSTALLLLLAALGLGFLAFILSRTPGNQPPPGLEDWNTPLLQDVDLNGLCAIALSNDDRAIHLVLSNTTWQVAERYGYPADRVKLRALMDGLRKAVLVEAVDVEAPYRNELGLADGQGVALNLAGPGGRTLFALKAGGMHMKKPEGPAASFYGGYPDGRYVQTARGLFLLSDSLDSLDEDLPGWLDKEFVQIPGNQLASLAIEGPGRNPVRLTRLTEALAYFAFADVADPALPDPVTGFSTGIVVTATTTNGAIVAIRIGNAEAGQDRRYVKIAVTGPEPLPEPAARLAARLTPWIYRVENGMIEPLLAAFDPPVADPKSETIPASTRDEKGTP